MFVKHLKLLTITLAAIVLATVAAIASAMKNPPSHPQPDFAFPEKVEKQALKDLRQAEAQANAPEVVAAVVRYAVAKATVSTDSLPAVLRFIAETSERQPQAQTRALLTLLQARIYADIYAENSWKYNRRGAVETPSEDYSEWGRQEFLDRVRRLVSECVADTAALAQTPTADFKDALASEYGRDNSPLGRDDLRYYPTLLDVVGTRAIQLLGNFSQFRQGVLNPEILQRPADRPLWPDTPTSPDGAIMGLYALVDGNAEKGSAPWTVNRINWLNFLSPKLFNPDGNSEELLSQAFYDEFEANAASPYAGDFLMAMNIPSEQQKKREYYRLLCQFVAEHKDYGSTEAMKTRIKEIIRPSVSCQMPDVVVVGEDMPVSVECENAEKITLRAYDVTGLVGDATDHYVRFKDTPRLGAPCDTAVVTFSEEAPFAATAKTSLRLPKDGCYIVVAFIGNETAFPSASAEIVRATSLLGGSLVSKSGSLAWVVNPLTGQPQQAASLHFIPWTNKAKAATLRGMTDADGLLDFSTDVRGQLQALRGSDRYSPAWSDSEWRDGSGAWIQDAYVATSLGLYRPGDEVQFAVVAYETLRGNRRLSSSNRLKIGLRDANWQQVDTAAMVTDQWGRAEGRFTLPSEGLQGRYTVDVETSDSRRQIASGTFMVSDYKLPTFYVAVDSITPPSTPQEGAVIKGRALTFTDFPVEDAQVEAALTVRTSPWPWSAQSPQFATVKAATAADGSFTLEIPAGVISSSPAPRGVFTAEIAVTSASGETQQAQARFNMGKPLVISVQIPDAINREASVKASVEVLDAMWKPVQREVRYEISDTTTHKHFEGSIDAGSLETLLKGLPVGNYVARFTCEDADPSPLTHIMVYSPDSPVCPAKETLWVPEDQITADAEGRARVIFGSDCADAYVLAVVSDQTGKMLSRRVLRPRRGMQTFDFTLPEGVEGATVVMRCCKNYRTYESSVRVRSQASFRSLSLKIETFRQSVAPNAEEEISLQVTSNQPDLSPQSAVMLDMTNKAIDVLQPNPIGFPSLGFHMATPGVFGLSVEENYVRDYGPLPGGAPWQLPLVPALNFYGQTLFPHLVYENMLMAAPMGRNMAMKMADVAMTESAAEEDFEDADALPAGAGAEEGDEATPSQPQEKAEAYRPCEIPLAFFRPMLTTDTAGRLTTTYRVPNANTAWVLRALAYNADVFTATAQAEIISAKPLMVSTNAPRFVRCGDRVTLPALVMNNTDAPERINVVWQVVNTSDGRVLKEYAEQIDSLAPKTSRAVAHEYDVTGIEASITFRVKATTVGDNTEFTDGEQTLLPVLPAMQDVVESEMFYIAPSDAHFSMPLTARQEGSKTLLSFTENPTWEVVSALPGLREGKISSSLAASASLFSACVCQGLLRQYPEVAIALRRWQANPQDSMLISNLQKNKELQQMLLSSTPWVEAAQSDTERLQRLALLLDGKSTRRAIDNALSLLSKTAASGGGWMWAAAFPEYSSWANSEVLFTLGVLNRLGWLPDDKKLADQIASALKRVDHAVAEQWTKSKKPQGAYYVDYAYMRSLWPDVRQGAVARQVSEAAVQHCIGHWREGNVADKAVAALLLGRSNYPSTARLILESLRQLATTSAEKGMWWQQLDHITYGSLDRVCVTALLLEAFATIEPSNPDVDRIRQWLILQKANTDWGSPVVTTRVVASILMSGKRWTVNPQGTAVRVGDTLLHPATVFETGSFTENITALVGHDTSLTIDRQADYPSFGSVMTMRRTSMESLKAVGCREAKIQKSYSAFRSGRWVEAEEFRVGERVRVTLTIKADTDFDYVIVSDERPSGFEVADQMPGWAGRGEAAFYRENRDAQTNLFRPEIRRGTTVVAYDLFAAQPGVYASGAASVSSSYNPLIAAHSAGCTLRVLP